MAEGRREGAARSGVQGQRWPVKEGLTEGWKAVLAPDTPWHGNGDASARCQAGMAAQPTAVQALPCCLLALYLMPCRLREEGLSNQMFGSIAEAYIIGRAGQQTLAQAVEGIRQAHAEAEARTARRTRILQLLTEEGLQAYLPSRYAAGGGGWVGGLLGGFSAECLKDVWQGSNVQVFSVLWSASMRLTQTACLGFACSIISPFRILSAESTTSSSCAEYDESPVPGLTSYVDKGKGSEDAGKGTGGGAWGCTAHGGEVELKRGPACCHRLAHPSVLWLACNSFPNRSP